jgi:tryptophan synthase alpha chain
VGFGIRDGASARAVAQIADAVVVGSRLVEEIEKAGAPGAVAAAARIIGEIRRAIDEGPTGSKTDSHQSIHKDKTS